HEYVAPRDETERQLVAIWAETLGLEADQIGVKDNFFELGGHSLLATRLMSKVRDQFGVDLPLKTLFAKTTIADFAPLMGEGHRNEISPIVPVARFDTDGREINTFPLSYAQERLWFIDQFEQGQAGYNIPMAVSLHGKLDIAHLEQAFQLIIHRHENLRTIFPSQNGRATQVVVAQSNFTLECVDLSDCSDDILRREDAKQRCQAEAVTPFDLATGPLLRVKLLKLTPHEHVLMLTMHHIISDGWSSGVMMNEFSQIMQCLQAGREPALAPLPIQYLDYSVWQRKLLDEEGLLTKQLAYWQDKLAGVPELFEVATDYPRPVTQSVEGGSHTFRLEAKLAEQLKTLSEQQDSTLFMTLLAVFTTLLYRYSGQDDICLGSPIANRQYGETEGLIGMFVNTLALRNQVSGEASFSAFLQQVKTTCLEAYEHQDTPFEKIVEALPLQRNLGVSPLFQIMFVLQNNRSERLVFDDANTTISPYPLENTVSKFDLTLSLAETDSGLQGSLAYRKALYKPQTIARMAQHFETLCQAIVNNPDNTISDLQFVSTAETQQLLSDFNQAQDETNHHQDLCIHTLFSEQAKATPDKTALVYQNQKMSYQTLQEKSQTLALYLQSLGVRCDRLVGLCTERSPDMMVGLLGILQAGAAYLPLDPGTPNERLAYMAQDSQVSIILTQQKHMAQLQDLVSSNVRIIALDEDWLNIATNVTVLETRQVSLRNDVKPDNLAYVIYTSGSTGKPKGVMIEHRMLVDYAFSVNQKMALDQCETFASLSTFSADLGNTTIYVPIMFGKTIHLICSDEVNEPARFRELLNKHPIDCMKVTPSHFEMFRGTETEIAVPEKVLIFAGEPLTQKIVATVNQLKPECRVFNNYGPTETTIAKLSTTQLIASELDCIPLGKPLDNTQVYILDQFNHPVPVGVPGELHIAGRGLARGYLNRPDLSAEKFVANPFMPGTRMYKTGDQVRWLEDGNIEYLGRVDTQVKIRGFRIETGEIESKLNAHPQVKDSVVVAQGQDSNKRLVAFYVTPEDLLSVEEPPSGEGLKAWLRQSLPSYMVPVAFKRLDSIPLTPNRKVDRQRLERQEVSVKSGKTYIAPRNQTEAQLLAIWADLLDLKPEKIGVNDNFFELGGHSLLATRLISKVRAQFTVDIPVKVLFEHASIAGFAAQIIKTERDRTPAITPVKRTDENGQNKKDFPLSYAQERLWFIDQFEQGQAGYNIPMAISLHGKLDIAHLEQAFQLIIHRHENLRTIFPSQNGRATQVVVAQPNFTLEFVDLSDCSDDILRREDAKQRCQAEATTPFDLATGPLLRVKLLKLTPHEHVLMLTMHHIISDGWSSGVMMNEFSQIMQCLQAGREPALAPLPIQYLDYSVWQRQLLDEEGLLTKQLAYWQDKLAGVPELFEVATDYPRPVTQSVEGDSHTFRLEAKLAEQLKTLSEQQDSTLFMILLAVFNVLLYRYSGQDDICLGSPIANRQYGETEGLIGMFVNTLALRNQVSGEMSFTAFLQQVKTTCLEAYEHQDTPFEKIVEALPLQRNLGVNPLFQIMFVLQNNRSERLVFDDADTTISPYPLENTVSKFDLTLSLAETDSGLQGSLTYRTSLYKASTIERLAGHFMALCQSVVVSPTKALSAFQFMGEAERHRFLKDFNHTAVDYPKDKCIHEGFIEQVAKNPENVAIEYQNETLTYGQLYERSSALACYLQAQAIERGSLVALCMERSPEMIVGMLGILQAGCAYVPLDANHPDDRLAYMLEDSGVAIVLTQNKLKERLKALVASGTTLVAIDRQWPEIIAAQAPPRVQLNREVLPSHLAYVIYTSGSTGKSKGVMVEHRGVMNLIQSQIAEFAITNQDKCLQNFSICFDAAVLEIYLALLSGASLVITSAEEQKDPAKLVHYLQQHSVTCAILTPSYLTAIGEQPLSLRVLVTGGEAANDELLKYHAYQGTDCYNAYGPTETCVCSTTYSVPSREGVSTVRNSTPIGQPINNTQLYILDAFKNPVPIGTPGELYIAGDGLARGYLNRPELTQERFIANPFTVDKRMYKSGDLARWLDDGNIEYLGRMDTQVKIRGFRIETGEVEAQLKQHPEIKDSVVVVQGQGAHKKLIAFYVAAGDAQQPTHESLKTHLLQSLPDYMVPAAFQWLEAIPLTPNGKVNRQALEKREVTVTSEHEYVAPRDETERQLVVIWAETLGLEAGQIGVKDNFFELGGHSLLATRLMSKVRDQFGVDLPLKTLFAKTTIADFAPLMGEGHSNEISPIVPVARYDADGREINTFPLSYAQERLWFIDQFEQGQAGYNIPMAISLHGKLDIVHLEQAFQLIIHRHENLRTIFPSQNGRATQVVVAQPNFTLECVDLSDCSDDILRREDAKQRCQAEAVTPFDLATGPLLRVKLLKLTPHEHVLMLTMHHIISDGWSSGVMMNEFSQIMQCLQAGREPALAPLPIQYLDYSVWQRKLLDEEGLLNKQLAYWQNKLAGVP
ncbi:non-ribosomal peptide synthetase, partial [Marinibactrum halimedae]|uniref:non-ribosomal peptide synthetase n=1 Tax=Marinibactrum halimedae TaxID=1444977 RepID=UPI001E3FAC56